MIGKVDEIFGPINSAMFTIKMAEGIVASSYKASEVLSRPWGWSCLIPPGVCCRPATSTSLTPSSCCRWTASCPSPRARQPLEEAGEEAGAEAAALVGAVDSAAGTAAGAEAAALVGVVDSAAGTAAGVEALAAAGAGSNLSLVTTTSVTPRRLLFGRLHAW